jgi:hypothetical protein
MAQKLYHDANDKNSSVALLQTSSKVVYAAIASLRTAGEKNASQSPCGRLQRMDRCARRA